MKNWIKNRGLRCMLLLVIALLSAPGQITKASAVVDKADLSIFEITPDFLQKGTNEELEHTTFHDLILPAEQKDNGIMIALPVPGKGRVHYYIGVKTVESADLIKPQIFEDAAGTIPLKNRYESDEVYDYYYNFDVPKKGTYYIKLTAPEYGGKDDLPLSFYAQYYSAEDRTLEPDVQAFCAVIDKTPVYYKIITQEDGTISVTADNYFTDKQTKLILCNDKKEEISDAYSDKNDSAVKTSYQVKTGTYYLKVTNESDFYRITYHFDNGTAQVSSNSGNGESTIQDQSDKEVEDGAVQSLPKTGERTKPGIYLDLAVFCAGMFLIIKYKK